VTIGVMLLGCVELGWDVTGRSLVVVRAVKVGKGERRRWAGKRSYLMAVAGRLYTAVYTSLTPSPTHTACPISHPTPNQRPSLAHSHTHPVPTPLLPSKQPKHQLTCVTTYNNHLLPPPNLYFI